MAPSRVVSMLTWLLLAIVGGGGTEKSGLCEATGIQVAEDCPRCDAIFSMVETTPKGQRVQNIKMRERGNVRQCRRIFTFSVYLSFKYLSRTGVRYLVWHNLINLTPLRARTLYYTRYEESYAVGRSTGQMYP